MIKNSIYVGTSDVTLFLLSDHRKLTANQDTVETVSLISDFTQGL